MAKRKTVGIEDLKNNLSAHLREVRRGALERERANWTTMSLTADVVARAGRAFPVEPVKALDAIHLATALAFAEAFPDLEMLALDRRVLENATALGLAPA